MAIVALNGLPLDGSGADDGPREIEAYSRLIAMAVVGVEEAVGSGVTGGFANLLAREIMAKYKPPEGDLRSALEWLGRNTVFRVDTYRVGGRLCRDEGGEKAFYLIARECPVRQILYLEDLPAGRTLCRIMCSYLERLFAERLGGRYRVKLARTGPNACLLRGVVVSGNPPPDDLEVRTEPPSREEYVKLLHEMLSAILRGLSRALYLTLGSNPAMSYRAGKSYGRHLGAMILAEGYEASSLEEAVEILNEGLQGMVKTRLEGDKLFLEWSWFHDIVEKEGIEHPEFIHRLVQGFIAGILEMLLGRRIELRSTQEQNVYRVMQL
ncbi:hypothetical protein [Pyrodictium abyssi]|uniref:Uncharacterized protein n=1 Tax=Pyrodictium abyssi TaxID=54256 RepID=A0ABN6ZSP1_9CREN|nr:hypothetical protein PABY_11720 [Pyrodictium abyssi]